MSSASAGQQPLDRFPLIRTRSVDELIASVTRYYGHIDFKIPRDTKSFNVRANHCQLQSLGLSYATHGSPLEIELPAFEYFGQLFSLGGNAEAGSGRATVPVDRTNSCVASSHESTRLKYAGDFKQLALKINAAALNKKFEALTGAPLKGQLRFELASDLRQPGADFVRRQCILLVEQLSEIEAPPSTLALAEFEQSIMVAYLCGNRHNHAQHLERNPDNSSPWQVRLAEGYIEANWDQPLTVEALTIVTGISARSIFHSFKQHRGYSPMEFVRGVRLKHANELLVHAIESTSVTDVAFSCGFGNLGHFARYYRHRFGESPSQTLNRARGVHREAMS
ncbi:AraC family transcriptional regulator [Rhodoplanes sp. Z2-YC6860]|uniref:AraC family transcriptional regulator n=1 Tax=Rhodoplanes sp. Z2-YC6860 TaxID=674703 RepID=UPI00078D4A7E|nr:AraC family transcriptional regulator [Rhodoplanes sp. Z2-YC6860]AMN43665.1 transcriptional regulator, AraC family [Rhodoplanes sp. Z2-YC6860]